MAIVARFSFDVPFGEKARAFEALSKWKALDKELGFPEGRMLVGSIGSPESRIETEYVFESLAQLESAWSKLNDPRMASFQEAIAPFVVPGSHRWEVLRIQEW